MKTTHNKNPQHQTVPAVFRNSVRKYGDRVALRQKVFGIWRDISWNTYYEKAKSVGLALISMGLQKGDCVSIIGDNCPEWVMIDMGVQCVGGVSVGIYATNAPEQCEYVVNHSELKFHFVENEEQLDKWLQFRENAPHVKKVIFWDVTGLRNFSDPMVMTFDQLLELGEAESEKHPNLIEQRMAEITPDDLSLLIYTSGTTGPPKGAMLTHRNVTWMAEAVARANPIFETDEVMSFLPLCHIFERLFSVFAHIRHGYVVNFIENVDTVTDNMREISPTVGYGVPRVWEKYAAFIQIKMSDATWFKRTIFGIAVRIGEKFTRRKPQNGSRWIGKSIAAGFANPAGAGENLDGVPYPAKPPFYLTIAYHIVRLLVLRKLKERLGFDRLRIAYTGAAPISPDVLRFFQSLGVNLLEGYGQTEGSGVATVGRMGHFRPGTVGQAIPGITVKIAEDGEILIKSPAVFKGYFKDPQTTTETLQDGWLHSGDLGEIDAEGYLKIIGRKKDLLITSGGKNISPQYIENRLKFSPYINDAVIIGDGRRFLSAIVVIDEDNVVKYAQDHKIHFSTYRDLAGNPAINALIQTEIDGVNVGLARVEQIKKFVILPKKLYEEDGEVTPTMKVKRQYINAAYGDLIEGLYRE